MDGGRASLVLASWPPASSPHGPVVTDDPSWVRDAARDVLLEDILVADRYGQHRYDAAQEAFARIEPGRLPTDASDYEYAFVQSYVDLAVRVDRLETVLRDRTIRTLAIPAIDDRTAWAAAEAARRLGITVETYTPASSPGGHPAAGRTMAARTALTLLEPLLFARFRRRQLRILTTDLGLLDGIAPRLGSPTGILSPGLGVAERMGRGPATFAWLRHRVRMGRRDLVSPTRLTEAARVLAVREGGAVPALETAAWEVLSSGSVNAVVLSDDKTPANHAIVRLAAAAGVPSVVVQHGITGHPVGFLPINATRFAAWGPACSEWLASRGASRSVIVETGDPRYDGVFRNREALRAEGEALFRSQGIPPNAKVAVFFSQPVEGRAAAFHMVLDAAAGLPLRIVTKVHPGEGVSLYRNLAGRRGIDAAMASGSAKPYLCAAVAAMSQSSGLAVVAAQLGIPVILLEPVALKNLQAYDVRWPRATDAASLRAQLASVLLGTFALDRTRALGEEYGGPADGRAGERVAWLIEGMVRDHA